MPYAAVMILPHISTKKKITIWAIVCTLAAGLAFAGYLYFPRLDQYGHPSFMTGASGGKSSDVILEPSEPVSTGEAPYVLPILGESKLLKSKQNASMQQWRTDVEKMARERPGEIFINGPMKNKAVALTFDDGPDDLITPLILTRLAGEGVKAAFFVTGCQVEHFPDQVAGISAQGHLVLSHAYSHRQLTSLTMEEVKRELDTTDRLISQKTGKTSIAVRPPYGAINNTLVDELSREGRPVILWSIDTLDWTGDDARVIASNVLDHVRPGDIILMHSITARKNTAEALPLIIQGLHEKGYSIVRLDQLLERSLDKPD